MLSFFHFFGLIKLFSYCSSLLSLYATWSFCPPSLFPPFSSPLPLHLFPFRTPFLNAFNSNDEKVSASSTKDNNKYGQAQHMPSGGGVEEVQTEVWEGVGGIAWRCRGHLQVAGFQRHFPSFLRLLRFIFPLLVHVLFSLLLLLSCFLLCFFVMSCVFPLFFVGGSDNELMFLIDEEIWVAIRTDCG